MNTKLTDNQHKKLTSLFAWGEFYSLNNKFYGNFNDRAGGRVYFENEALTECQANIDSLKDS